MQPQLSVISLQASVIEDFLSIIAAYLVVCVDQSMDPEMSEEDLSDIVRFCDLYPGGWQPAIDAAFHCFPTQDAAKTAMMAYYALGRGAVA